MFLTLAFENSRIKKFSESFFDLQCINMKKKKKKKKKRNFCKIIFRVHYFNNKKKFFSLGRGFKEKKNLVGGAAYSEYCFQ